ncbi:hypothetical protein Tco_0122286 [Tanacetum coccineum]
MSFDPRLFAYVESPICILAFEEVKWMRPMHQDNSKEWNSGDDQLRLRWMIYLVVLADAAESVRDTIGFEYCLASSSGWTNSMHHIPRDKFEEVFADANLHVPLNEIKIDKTLHFVEELMEIMDRKIRNLKRSKIPLVKVHWNLKRGPEFTWERKDHMKSKYPQLFVDRVVELAS